MREKPIRITPNPIEPIITPEPICTAICNYICFMVLMIIIWLVIPSLIIGFKWVWIE